MKRYYSFKVELILAMAICLAASYTRGYLWSLITWYFTR